MPEVDVLHALAHLVQKEQRHYARTHLQKALTGHLQLFPRTFATGTKSKNWITCTTNRLGYKTDLEPVPEAYEPNHYDASRSKNQPWEYLVKPLEKGEVIVKPRGKELFFACGYHGVRMNLGLEASMLRVRTKSLSEILGINVPGPNVNKTKADKLRSFLIANHFIVQGSQKTASKRTINIFAAIICEDVSFILLWDLIWGPGHGPDWIDETSAAMQQEYLDHVTGTPNLDNFLDFNYKSHRNYMATYVYVYRKQDWYVSTDLYNKLYRTGMLDHKHIIGEPYQYDPAKLATQGERKLLPVFMYKQGKFKVYSIIRAQPPEDWAFQGGPGVLADDARHAGYRTTLGPAQFRNQVQNMRDPKQHDRPGRRSKHNTGKPGRPGKNPRITDVCKQATVGLDFERGLSSSLRRSVKKMNLREGI
ncbi:predicted protein [Sparassis crispa]|uniref:Uncharacterized protein n=1 Tax=Sparassis crispa TaxID=139825 RepID=A0A401GXD4_9APHY|nr:predicted protein [Sparassis crispa]GBE86434.1 predicted protein [Sparassis crispa]